MKVRRVITGTTDSGAAVITDDLVEPITVGLMPGAEFHAGGGADSAQQLPNNGHQPQTNGWFPRSNGHRFACVTIGPDAAVAPDLDLIAGINEIAEKLPGMVEVLEPDHPGMHTTDTIDYAV